MLILMQEICYKIIWKMLFIYFNIYYEYNKDKLYHCMKKIQQIKSKKIIFLIQDTKYKYYT